MHTLEDCHTIIEDVLKDSTYHQSYNWDNASENGTASETIDRSNGYAMLHFISAIIQENNAPCAEEVIGLLEEFIQESKANHKPDLLEELRVALNAAG